MNRTRFSLALALLALAALLPAFVSAQTSPAQAPLLLRNPSLSQDKIAFRYADDIWTVSRQGGDAERLTSNGHVVAGPFFSPDGAWIAYSAHLHGNTDVYVIPAAGGVPRRITWHPAGSDVVGWSPDGKDVLIASGAASYRHFLRLFRVHADGSGVPEPLPLPSGFQGSFSPDGQSHRLSSPSPSGSRPGSATWAARPPPSGSSTSRLSTSSKCRARTPTTPTRSGWATQSTSSPTATAPFRSSATTPAPKQVSQVVPNTSYDLKSFQAGPGGLVYEQFGSIHLLDTATNADKTVSIQIHGELASLAPHRVDLRPDEIQNAALSPTGARAVFEAHGEIFTVPGEKGDTRNLTQTPGVAERNPSWSPDGKTIAYFSDASGEYQLYLHDQTGFKPPTVIDLGPDPSFFYNPTWSPDSKHIAYTDKHLRLWYVDVPAAEPPQRRKPVLVDKGTYGSFGADFGAVWSPDSMDRLSPRPRQPVARHLPLLAGHAQIHPGHRRHERRLQPRLRPQRQVSLLPGLHRRRTLQRRHRSLFARPRRRPPLAYVVVLAKDGASPIPPESDDEKIKDEKKDDKKDADKKDDDKDKTDTKDDKKDD